MVKSMFLGAFCAALLILGPSELPCFGHTVMAEVLADVSVYNEKNGGGGICGEIRAGETVEILEDRSENWYRVAAGWVAAETLSIPPDTAANREVLSTAALEAYVNGQGIMSATAYLLFTDLDRQQTHVFAKAESGWTLCRSFACSTGKNASPTKHGQFTIEARGDWFFSERLGSGARYWMRFDGPYLYHSLPMDANREITDCTIGERVSSGCVRLALADALWLYENVPDKSAVLIR